MKPAKVLVAVVFCIILSASPALAASSNHGSSGDNNSQPLSLSLEGQITNAGNQVYRLSGGHLVHGSVDGNSLSPGEVSLSMEASVQGLRVIGEGTLTLSPGEGQGGHGGRLNVQISINGAVPAAVFPLVPVSPGVYANCDPTSMPCNSEIPLLFTGIATIFSSAGSDPTQVPIAIESPYWSPFGGPILITSLDSPTPPSIVLVMTYSAATIGWSGVQLQGQITSGTFGTESPITGLYSQSVFSQENLVTGSEFDVGNIMFTAMSDPTLDAQGGFAGHTTFTLAGSFDCAVPNPTLYFPGLPDGTCTATGATSSGSFHMVGDHSAFISGTYNTYWSVPSLFTLTTVVGAVVQH